MEQFNKTKYLEVCVTQNLNFKSDINEDRLCVFILFYLAYMRKPETFEMWLFRKQNREKFKVNEVLEGDKHPP